MQKQLLIIGNGFDKACDLPSGYGDFYKAIIKENYTKDKWENLPQDFWFILLRNYDTETENYNWCQIERIIKDTLDYINSEANIKVCGYLEAYKNEYYGDLPQSELKIPLGNDRIQNLILMYFCDYITGYHKDKVFKLSSFEWIIEAFYCHLLKELNNLEKSFCEYLRAKLCADYIEKADKLFTRLFANGIASKYNANALSKDFFNDISVLSFNYTIPYNHILQYSNVHGVLCSREDCQSCNDLCLIFGIDDKDTREKNEPSVSRIFSKTYRALFLPNKCQKRILPFKNESVIIKIFGHSLDPADYSYFQSIFDYYNIYENALVSLKFYYRKYDGRNIEDIKTDKTDSVYNLMSEYGATIGNEHRGNNLLHKLILEKRIEIIELK